MVSAVAIYLILWSVVLFAILPIGVRGQHEEGERALGTDPGAPVVSGMRTKIVLTTLVSAVLFGVLAWANAEFSIMATIQGR